MIDNPNFYDIDAEKAILGAVLVDNSCMDDIRGLLAPDDFYQYQDQLIWTIFQERAERKYPIDIISTNDEVKLRGYQVYLTYITSLNDNVCSSANVKYYVKIVKDKSIKRSLWKINSASADDLVSGNKTGIEIANDLEQGASNLATKNEVGKYVKIGSVIPTTIETLEFYKNHPDELRGLPSGFKSVDNITGGIREDDYIIIGARPSQGKAQPLDAKIKTPDSWIRMGDIKVGDKIASIDGADSYVTGVFPQGVEDVYRITFSDGRSTECSGNHLWQIGYRSWNTDKVMSTKMLITRMKAKRNRKRLYIPLVSGKYGKDTELPIDPWLLGVLLGDGCLCKSTIELTSADIPIVDRVRKIVRPTMDVHYKGKYGYTIVNMVRKPGHHTILRDNLEKLGLYGTQCFDKFIPREYLDSSFENRVELLNGLIATDGEVGIDGNIGYSTVSSKLKDDIVELARSLGGICSVQKRITHFTYKGVYKAGAPSYRIYLLMPEEMKPSLLFLKRHYDRINFDRKRENRLTIRSIEYSRTCETQCIMVSHSSELYITDDYIVTHNTAMAVTMANNIAIESHIPVGFFSCEMSKELVNERQVFALSGITKRRIKFGHLNATQGESLQNACMKIANAPFFIDDTPNITLSAFRASARKMIHNEGVKIIFIDYLGLMNAEKPRMARWEQIGLISRELKEFCRESHVPLVVLAQLTREAQGKKPTLAELRDSGSLEQDSDTIFFLHREKEPEINAEIIETDLICAKQRNGPVGTIKLNFYPELVKFEDKEGNGK